MNSPLQNKVSNQSRDKRSKPLRNHKQNTVPKINHVLFLKQCLPSFEEPNQRVSVFFDECNQEIISLSNENNSQTKIVVQATERFDEAQFSLPICKSILSIKLNSFRTVLAYHSEKSTLEFINIIQTKDSAGQLSYSLDGKPFTQTSRAKGSKLFGFLWTAPLELVMVTDISVEYYHVDPIRRRLRHVKSHQSLTNWFVYQPCLDQKRLGDLEKLSSYSILMTSTGSLGDSMQPYLFTRGQMMKLQRFNVEGDWNGKEKMEMFQRSITIAFIYNSIRLLVLQHESLNMRSKGAQILIYTVDIESGVTSKTHTLDLDVNGKFAINILDNLIVAHDQPSKSSFIFDIMIESTEKSDFPNHYVSLISGQPIKPFCFEGSSTSVEMYSLNWVFFQPNYVIDAKAGMLATLEIDLRAVQNSIQDNFLLLNFLARRKKAETAILEKCKDIISRSYTVATSPNNTYSQSPLADVSSTFEIVCRLILPSQEAEQKAMASKSSKGPIYLNDEFIEEPTLFYNSQIYQDDVHRRVLQQLDYPTDIDSTQLSAHVQFVSSTLLEFIFIMRKLGKHVEFCIHEQLINLLIRCGCFFQLVQMIRSDIFFDSKQLACLLLSLREKYRPAAQLGLDMLYRLDCLTDLVESLNLSPSPPLIQIEYRNSNPILH